MDGYGSALKSIEGMISYLVQPLGRSNGKKGVEADRKCINYGLWGLINTGVGEGSYDGKTIRRTHRFTAKW